MSLHLWLPLKKPVSINDLVKFNDELDALAEKYLGHSDIFVYLGKEAEEK